MSEGWHPAAPGARVPLVCSGCGTWAVSAAPTTTGLENLRSHANATVRRPTPFAELSSCARSEVLALAPCMSPTYLDLRRNLHLNLQLLGRGVSMRIVTSRTQQLPSFLSRLAQGGASVRISSLVSSHYLMLIDREVAVFPGGSEVTVPQMLRVRSPVLVNGFLDLFERHWRHAAETSVRPVLLTNSQRVIVEGLKVGLTDDAIARRLDVCTRTVRRRIARLMRQLEARSRMELGMRIAEQDVLPGPRGGTDGK
jgi:DNA-binding NarL/FixJ family response regulator